jgi:hypothetical protein
VRVDDHHGEKQSKSPAVRIGFAIRYRKQA